MMKKYLLALMFLSATTAHLFAQNLHVVEDFNAGSLPVGWSHDTISGTLSWSFGIDGCGADPGNQNLDGTNFAYFDDDILGSNPNHYNNTAALVTPAFDNSASPITTLEFDYNFRQYGPINDSFYVEVDTGSGWNRVFSQWQDDCGRYINAVCRNNFPHANIDISSYKSTSTRVRFVYHDGNDRGFYVGIDNVEIYSPLPNDIGVAEIIQPKSGCGLTASDSVEVKIKNYGYQDAPSFSVSFTVNGGTAVTENINTTLLAGDSMIYTFSGTANLSTIGTYDIAAYTTRSGDGQVLNDTSRVQIENEPSYSPLYNEDFEVSDGGWTVSGTNASWARGIPTATSINTAPSGQRIFTTNLTGNYNNGEYSYLTSPCFDFSSTIGDPIMSFSLYYQTEANYDYSWMEYSTDNGLTWRKLPSGGVNPTNWYNNRTTQVWEGFSNGWLNVENVLVGFAGEPQVKFRMVMSSDGGTNYNGIGFDNFTVREPQPVDLSLNRVLYPASTTTPLCGYGVAENIIIELENKGANRIDTMYVNYQVDNGTIHSDTLFMGFLSNTLYNHTFRTKYNFSSLRNYTLDVWVETPRDGFTANDTIFNTRVINTQTVSARTIPYYESFDAFTNASQYGWMANSSSNYRWTSNSGPTPNLGTGPDFDHSTRNGVYIYTRSQSIGNDIAYYESPCFDLSNNSGAVLEFYYHRWSDIRAHMGPLYVDAYDGKSWHQVASISNFPQTSTNSVWTHAEVSLNAFAGRRMKFRFRARNQGIRGDIAIDDVRLYEPTERDARSLGAISPVSGCGISDSSIVIMEIENLGSRDILPDSMTVGYQIDEGPRIVETFRQSISSEAIRSHVFATKADLSDPGRKYNIKTWVDLVGDEQPLNDTDFKYQATNYTKSTNYFEDFETSRDANCASPLGQVLENGWVAEEGGYAWNVQSTLKCKGPSATPGANTGPKTDQTTGFGNFLYTDGGGAVNSKAVLLSPCLDLSANTNASLSFWYHRYGSQMGTLDVQARDSLGAWKTELSLTGQDQTSAAAAWKVATVNLDAYVGQFTQIRFVGTKGGNAGHMAIDDIHLYERINQDVGVVEIVSPAEDNSCNLSNAATVTIKVKNYGSQTAATNTVKVVYTNNNLQRAVDTIAVAIPPNGTVTHTFPQTVDLSGNGTQSIQVWTELAGDNITVNNRLERVVINRKVGFPYYFQDFETFEMGANYQGDDLKGWSRSPNGTGHTWHVWQGPAPTIDGEPMPNPPIEPNGPSGDHTFATDFQNGNGMYMLLETKFRYGGHPDATFTTPCGGIDFSKSKSNRILLSFYYHMFGNTGDLFIDVHNGTQWVRGVSVIRGSQQAKATEPWKEHQVSLNNFSHVTNGQIRFRAEFLGNLGGGDIGIDDISLLDQDTIDVAVKEFHRPRSDCNTSNQEQIRVRIQNVGFTDLQKINMAYQLTWHPINGDPVTYPVERDSTIVTVIRNAFLTFNFKERADMSQPGEYEFKVWSEVPGDNYGFNDTLVQVISNTARPFPYCEDFSSLLLGDIPKDFESEILPNWWKGNQGAYAFKAQLPGGHTTGLNDIFLFLDDADGNPLDEAWIETTCFDLTSTRAANLEFYYKAPNPQHVLFIEVRTVGGGVWQNLDTLYGKEVTDWTLASFVLADYVGSFVEFRLTGINAGGGGYYIDDFCLVRPLPQQIQLERIVSPAPDMCYYSDREVIRLRVQNVGIDRIDSFRVTFALDSTTIKYPVGMQARDTFWIYPTRPTLEPGDKMEVYLPNTYYMESKTEYFMNVYIYLPGDVDTLGNIIEGYHITHPVPIQIPYVVDFEEAGDPLNKMEYAQTGMFYNGGIYRGMSRPNISGPADDHTFQNGTGHYFRTNSAMGDPGDAVILSSICLDLSETVQPELQYWYHMFGYNMGQLMVEVNDDFGWKTVDSLKGEDPDQINNGRPWKLSQVKLKHPSGSWDYSGKYVRIRFVSYRGGDASDMALDDIFVFDLASKDLTPHALARPNTSIYSCYTDTQSVIVELRNNGSEDIDFTEDSTNITVQIRKNGVPWDTLTAKVKTNRYVPVSGPPARPLPRDTIVRVKMDGTFDMSEVDAMYDFKIFTDMKTEVLRRNDTIEAGVKAQRKAGEIVSIEPTDTVCYQTPVRLKIENFFGALKWQEKQHDAQGNGIWRPGFSFPSDSPNYVVILDTTSELRVQVCQRIETAPVKVNITKPYSGKPIHNSRCGPGEITTSIEFPYLGPGAYENIDSVFVYSNIDDEEYDAIDMGEPYLDNGVLRYDIHYADLQEDDTVYISTKMDSCWSPLKTMVIASINAYPVVKLADTNHVTVCQDTTMILNAGAVEGRQFTYDWTIVNPDGSILKDTNQTLIVDAWKLELYGIYKFTVTVDSDSGCFTDNSGPGDTLFVKITDSCVTSIAEHKFGDEFNIYPNPTSDELFIEYRSFTNLVGTIKLLSMDGKLIEEHENVNFRMETTRFDLRKQAKGVYFIKIETPEGVIVRKIVKS